MRFDDGKDLGFVAFGELGVYLPAGQMHPVFVFWH
jgi:hypothetical protein